MVPSGRCFSGAGRGNPRAAAPARVVTGHARLPGAPLPDANGRNSPDRRRSGSLRHTEIRVHRQDLISPDQLQDTEHGASTHHQPQLGINHASPATGQQQAANPGAITENRHRQIRDDNGHTGNDGDGQQLTDRVRINEIDLIRQHHHDSRAD